MIQAAREIKLRDPDARIVICSAFGDYTTGRNS